VNPDGSPQTSVVWVGRGVGQQQQREQSHRLGLRGEQADSSGIGRELGRQGMHEFTETHVMAIPSGG